MVIYDASNNEMVHPEKDDTVRYMETYPEWSPDGKYLYYCRAKQFIEGSDFKHIRYELVRRTFDQESRSFGKTEPVSMLRPLTEVSLSPEFHLMVITLYLHFITMVLSPSGTRRLTCICLICKR